MTATITNIVWEKDAPKSLAKSYELKLDEDYINELREYSEGDLSDRDIVENVIYEDLPTICTVDDIEYEVISFDFELK